MGWGFSYSFFSLAFLWRRGLFAFFLGVDGRFEMIISALLGAFYCLILINFLIPPPHRACSCSTTGLFGFLWTRLVTMMMIYMGTMQWAMGWGMMIHEMGWDRNGNDDICAWLIWHIMYLI
jgi:hypothetical protein